MGKVDKVVIHEFVLFDRGFEPGVIVVLRRLPRW